MKDLFSVTVQRAASPPPAVPSGASMRLSASACSKLRELREDEANPDLMLRVAVNGGGCSGFRYEFSLEDVAAEGDARIEQEGVCVLVDPVSAQYLVGAELDYVDDLQGAQFVVRNPNAQATCGCGSSFSV